MVKHKRAKEKKFFEKDFYGKKETIFIAKFFIIFLILQFIILNFPLQGLENFIASFEAGAMHFNSSGNRIFFDSQNFEIGPNCTGLLSGAIFIAVVFALKRPNFGKKAAIAVTGAIVLFVLNFPRIWLVLWTARYYGHEAALLLHEISWYATAIIVLIIWYYAMKKIGKIKNFSELI